MKRWTQADIPLQRGRSVIVTGTGGLGLEDSLALARAGADVIVAGRNSSKGAAAVARIVAEAPEAKARFERIDLASLTSVAEFCARIRDQRDSLDLLINNAGVMTPPTRQMTEDGFELQLGANYLGHFALTAGLLPLLKAGNEARVISLSSIAARRGAIDFDDLQAERGYSPMATYSQSKLACLMFAYELQRRSETSDWGVSSIAAHPGVSRTDLLHNGPGRGSAAGTLRSLMWFMFQPAARGALPTLYAATSPDAKPGAYYGPNGMSEISGYPAVAKAPPQALDEAAAERLWRVSEQLTSARF